MWLKADSLEARSSNHNLFCHHNTKGTSEMMEVYALGVELLLTCTYIDNS